MPQDALTRTHAPVVASHSKLRAVHDAAHEVEAALLSKA